MEPTAAQLNAAGRLGMALCIPGITPKQRRKVFNAFWADDPANTTRQGRRHYARNALWSPQAREAMAAHLADPEAVRAPELVQEHVVPVKVQLEVLEHLLAHGMANGTSARHLAQTLVDMPVAIITREQDALLRRAGLASRMPQGWDAETGSPWARYDAAGIEHGSFTLY